MVGITFDMHDLWRDVLRLITQCMDDHSATDGAIRACGTRFGCAGDFEGAGLRQNWCHIKAQYQGSRATCAYLEKLAASQIHDYLHKNPQNNRPIPNNCPA